MFPTTAISEPPPHSKLTCRSYRFSAKMSNSSDTDAQRSPRRGSPSPTRSPRRGSPSPTRSPRRGSPSPAPSSSSSGEPLGLDEGDEFILVKVSKKKGKFWATFLNDDPDHSCDGHGHFALGTSIEEILERRKRHHENLDKAAGKKETGTLSPDREYGFSNLNVREQGEKPSPGLRQASKSIPPNNESSSSEPWNPDWEGRAENVWRRETESWGTPYHHTPEHRQEAKAIDKSWGETRKRYERADRDAVMAGGSSPPSKKRAATKTFMDDIDDPNGEIRQSMTAQEKREQDRFSLDVKSPKGYKTREVQLTRTYLWGD